MLFESSDSAQPFTPIPPLKAAATMQGAHLTNPFRHRLWEHFGVKCLAQGDRSGGSNHSWYGLMFSIVQWRPQCSIEIEIDAINESYSLTRTTLNCHCAHNSEKCKFVIDNLKNSLFWCNLCDKTLVLYFRFNEARVLARRWNLFLHRCFDDFKRSDRKKYKRICMTWYNCPLSSVERPDFLCSVLSIDLRHREIIQGAQLLGKKLNTKFRKKPITACYFLTTMQLLRVLTCLEYYCMGNFYIYTQSHQN